jgi:hypothetical protein
VCVNACFQVFHQDFAEKKRLGQDFLVSDKIVEHTEEPLVLYRRQEFKLVWPMSNRETVTIRGGRQVGDKFVQFETSVDHPHHPIQGFVTSCSRSVLSTILCCQILRCELWCARAALCLRR